MNDDMEKHIKALIARADETPKSEDAMRFSQAAANAANAYATLDHARRLRNQ